MSLNSVQSCCRFSLTEIQTATRSFDDELVIGHGGFGKVYKGCISTTESNHVVAVKRLDSTSDQGAPEFRAEIEMLSKLRHCHLVSLIGFCDDNKEMILVYDYMPNGTLHDHLHKSDITFSWVQRLKIAVGAARGLDYLHNGVGTQHGVIHRDIKSSNILLDENWAAVISDFGLSKISPINQSSSYVDASVKGTFGYLDPEYYYTSKLTWKTDVFAFGVVLFELLSGRLPVDERYGEEECSLVRWAQKCVKERKLDQLVDSKIKGTVFPKCLRQFAQIAHRCLLSIPKERPTMTEVMASLQTLLELQNKHDLSSESPGIIGFTWNIHKYLAAAPKQNSESGISSPKIFTYEELKCATSGFDTHLGVYDYGKLHRGWVDKTTYNPCTSNAGLPIVVKTLHRYKHFDLEVLKKFHHPNLVQLIGYCLEGEQLFLVYEFMQNGNLEDLFRIGALPQLPLVTKVKIALGIARGIVFLSQTRRQVHESLLHGRDILLDEEFTAKLSGYDIAILVHGHFPTPRDLKDNRDMEVYYPGCEPIERYTNFSGFEVVLAEVLTGERIYFYNKLWKIDRFFSHCGNKSLAEIAKLCYESCNEVDSESKIVKLLKDYDELIRTRLKSWLRTVTHVA